MDKNNKLAFTASVTTRTVGYCEYSCCMIFDDEEGEFYLDGCILDSHLMLKVLQSYYSLDRNVVFLDNNDSDLMVQVYSYTCDWDDFLEFIISNVRRVNCDNWLDLIFRNSIFMFNDKLFFPLGDKAYTTLSLNTLYEEELSIASVVMFLQDFVCNNISSITHYVEIESGEEKEYSIQKYNTNFKYRRKHHKKKEKALSNIKPNSRKNREKIRKLKNDIVNLKHGIDKESGIETLSKVFSNSSTGVAQIVEILEKCLGIYLIYYLDKPLYKGLAAIATMFRGSITMEAYNLALLLLADCKSWKTTLSDFVAWLKDAVVNLDKFRNNRFAKKFLHLVSQMISVFICPDILEDFKKLMFNNTFIDRIFEMFNEDSSPMESILHFLTYICNAVDVFVRTGELVGFLETQTIDDEIVTELRELRESHVLFKNGDLEFIRDYKIYDYVKRLSDLRVKMSNIRKSRKTIELRDLDNWMKEVEAMEREVATTSLHEQAKYQGYYLLIASGSGISKGHLMKLFASCICRSMGIPYGKDYTFYLNQGNKYQSGWKNHTTTVMVDDAGAMVPESSDAFNLADWLLRASNNMPHELLSADIAGKGALFNKSLVEVWSSNFLNCHLHEKAHNVSALQRRFQVKIVGHVKAPYTRKSEIKGAISSQIDYSSVPEEIRYDIAPDLWEFDLYRCEVVDEPIKVKTEPGAEKPEKDNDFYHQLITFEGKKMQKVGVETVIKFLVSDARRHFESQTEVLNMARKLESDVEFCPHGFPKEIKCDICSHGIDSPLTNRCNDSRIVLGENKYTIDHDALRVKNKLVKEIEGYCNDPIVQGDIFCKKPQFPKRVRRVKLKHVPEELYKFHSAMLYTKTVTYDSFRYKVTKCCDVASLQNSKYSVSTGNPLLDGIFNVPKVKFKEVTGIKKESGKHHSRKIRYMKSVLSLIKHRTLNTNKRWRDFKDTSLYLRDIKNELLSCCQTWFDTMVLDVIDCIMDKIIAYVEQFMKVPWDFVPVSVEGTTLGAYIHKQRPIYTAPFIIDYVMYRWEGFQQWLDNPYADVNVSPKFNCTKKMHDIVNSSGSSPFKNFLSWCISAICSNETNIVGFNEFKTKGGFVITNKERLLKTDEPSILRDTILPLLCCCSAISTFIPAFISSLSALYVDSSIEVSPEVGYLVPVEDIRKLDSDARTNWYKTKQEIMVQRMDLSQTIKFTELEKKVDKNCVNVLNQRTSETTGGFSPANTFLILPWHFVESSLNDTILVRKYPYHPNSPGNAFIEFTIIKKNICRLKGDCCLVYCEKYMDRMRTSNLIDWFPNESFKQDCVGHLVWKDRYGETSLIDAIDIKYNNRLNNECIFEGEPENPFEGHCYTAKTFKGFCGAVLVNHTCKKSHIMGIHVGGRQTTNLGVSCAIFRDDLIKAMNEFPTSVEYQSGLSLSSYDIELYGDSIYAKNPVFDTVDRIDDVEILGSTSKRIAPKARIVDTPICDDVIEAFKLKEKWKAPAFKFGGDKRHGVRSLYRIMSSRSVLKHGHLLEIALNDYRNRLLHTLNSNLDFWSTELVTLDDYQVVNGNGKRFVSGMNMSTKFDAHLSGKKSDHAIQNSDDSWTFNDYVIKEFHKRLELMKNGICTDELLIQSLKNEATLETKVEIGKVRSFFMTGTPFQMIMRKYLLTTCRFFCLNSPFTEVCVGINPHSTDWDKMFGEISRFKNFIATDFKNFDLTPLFEVLSSAIDMLFLPRRHIGVTDEEENVFKCIKHAILFPICDVNGDITILKGIIPSGINLTSIIGCIVNSLYYRMAFYFLNPKINTPFHEVCILRTFGDDAIGSTKDKRFTVRNILYAFSVIGVSATDARKNEVSKVLFYKVKDLEYLSRGFRKDPHFGVIVAPLKETSRMKTLCSHVPTKSVSIEALTGQCVDNFLLESSFHGKDIYSQDKKIIVEIVKKHDLERFCQTLDVTFEDRVKQWKSKYLDADMVTGRNPSSPEGSPWLSAFNLWDTSNWFEWTQNFTEQNTCNSVSRIEDVSAQSHNGRSNENPRVEKRVEQGKFGQISKESGVESDVVDKEQVLTYLDGSATSLSIGGAMPLGRMTESDASLAQFLSRPVKIQEYSWGNTLFTESFDPWNDLLANKRIANRISNYMLFRAKLKVKFVINGNSFYYGLLMCPYLPFANIDGRTRTSGLIEQHKIIMSQCPRIFLSPTTCESVVMDIPFFYKYDYIDLTSSISARSPGEIFMYQLVDLQHANQDIAVTLSTITISVYAWFEDVELQGPTHENLAGIVPQSGKEDESCTKKPISEAATSIASIASTVSKVPIIGPYATPIEQGAKVVSQIASALGYSKPIDVEEPHKYLPRNTQNIAVTNTTSAAYKMTLDVKQETTIDPRTVGLSGEDELSIQKIASTDSYITTFGWTTAQSPSTLLWNIMVTPMIAYVDTSQNAFMTAMCGASVPFAYWTGTLIYRFVIVAAAQHRGRLAITYDPYESPTGATREDNIAYTEIVDIAANREFEIKVNNFQKKHWLSINRSWFNETTYGTSPLIPNANFENGTVSLFVLNELTSPSSDPNVGNNISVAVFVRAGDDFELANPNAMMTRYKDPIVSEAVRSSTSTKEPIYGVQVESGVEEIADGHHTIDHGMKRFDVSSKVYIGERVTSFRSLIKRKQAYTMVEGTTGGYATTVTHQAFPQPRGYVGNVPATGANEVSMTYLSYLMGGFAAWKGGFRWLLYIATEGNREPLPQTCSLSRTDMEDSFDFLVAQDLSPIGSRAASFVLVEGQDTTRGSQLSTMTTNPFLEIEVPFYATVKFIAGKPRTGSDITALDYEQGFRARVTREQTLTNERYYRFDMYVSAAEDFTCYFFTGFLPINVTVL